jgi:hypothetical protein
MVVRVRAVIVGMVRGDELLLAEACWRRSRDEKLARRATQRQQQALRQLQRQHHDWHPGSKFITDAAETADQADLSWRN